MALIVKDLQVMVEGKRILSGVNLEVKRGEVVALMGRNGSGKSSLAYAVAGHPRYSVVRDQRSEISLDGESLLELGPDERARKGLFLAMQQPVGVAGVKVNQLLLAGVRQRVGGKEQKAVSALELKKRIEKEAEKLGLNKELLRRGVNDGFSGGERKKMEILQMRILEPVYAILDETDSGLDIDALKIVAKSAYEMAKKKDVGVLVITHYRRLLDYLKPDRVLVMDAGKMVKAGGVEVLEQLEEGGYESIC